MSPDNKPLPGRLLTLLGWLPPLCVALASTIWLIRQQPDDNTRRVARARDDIRVLTSALVGEREGLPDTRQGLAALVADGSLPQLPVDPWGRPYRYLNPGREHAWELYSLGPDGIESSDDIVGWNLYGER